jgi:hypothetical protein
VRRDTKWRAEGCRLTADQEELLRRLIVHHTPDELELPQPLWTRGAVAALIE